MERKGIAIAGNILTDNVKIVQSYPQKGMLSTIEQESLAVGGCVPNVAISLKKVAPEIDVVVYGRVGEDEKGDFVIGKMQEVGIDVSNVKKTKTAPTSYSDVITVKGTGERTFFHNRGANKEFCSSDVDIKNLNAEIFHIGYIMLLDWFDKLGADNTTPMSNLLKELRANGIKTSVDLVSESNGNFRAVATCSLPYCDYVIINEIEAGAIVGIEPRDKDGKLDEKAVEDIMRKLLALGIKEKLIVHCPEKGFCLSNDGTFTVVDSIKIPKDFIKGSVGAGDAFCAGCLYAIYNGYKDADILSFANLVAINCLSQADSTGGVCKKERLGDVLNTF
jgi:sugar/nucleoside kinase (ribokinase family)